MQLFQTCARHIPQVARLLPVSEGVQEDEEHSRAGPGPAAPGQLVETRRQLLVALLTLLMLQIDGSYLYNLHGAKLLGHSKKT